MADIVSKLKTAALVAGASLFVVACGEKAAETTTETSTTVEAPAADAMAAPAADAAATDAMAAPAADAAAPAADAMAAPATETTTTTTTEEKK
jgi:hypothetical protein